MSLMSARSVLEAIDREKYEVSMIGITKEGRWIVEDDARDPRPAGDRFAFLWTGSHGHDRGCCNDAALSAVGDRHTSELVRARRIPFDGRRAVPVL